MFKKNRKYILILLSSFLVLIFVEYIAPKPIDWRRSYSKDDKIPYGNYILYSMLDELLGGSPVRVNYESLYELTNKLSDNTRNYILINEQLSPDSLDAQQLLELAALGNHIFIAAHNFQGALADTLQVATSDNYVLAQQQGKGMDYDSVTINFANPKLHSTRDYEYPRGTMPSYFRAADSLNTTILGRNSLGGANFIRINYGEGAFYLHSSPLAFTNYNMLHRNNSEYVAKALSYLPAQETIWDEYYKVGRGEPTTPLRFVLITPALRWAWYLLLGSVLLFVLFRAKRRQRAIPIVKPPQNTSLEFARTIGNLYYQHGNHKNLAEKKITYFFEYLRNHFYINTREINQELIEKIASKSEMPTEKVKDLFNIIAQVEGSPQLSEKHLQLLNNKIEEFYKASR